MEIIQRRHNKTLTTSATLPNASLLSHLQQPAFLFTLNPAVISHSKTTPAQSTSSNPETEVYTLTYRISLPFGYETSTSCIAHATPTVSGLITEVEAGVGWIKTKTRSSWSLDEGGQITEVFEVLSAPWVLRWFVWRSVGKSHKELFELLGKRLREEIR
jgi:hypothetical protein